MNPIEYLKEAIEKRVPTIAIRLRRPRNIHGTWWLDAEDDGHIVVIERTSKRGFGVSTSALTDGYGEGPEETFHDTEDVTNRVVELLSKGENTVPPDEVLLRELRALVGMSQSPSGEESGVQQAAVS